MNDRDKYAGVGYVDDVAENLKRNLKRYIDQKSQDSYDKAINYIDKQVSKIMKDIDQMSQEIQHSIETQTAAIIAGVGATTTAVISTKSELHETRNQLSEKLTLQLKSELQIELGRKLNVARSASTKFKQFFQEGGKNGRVCD